MKQTESLLKNGHITSRGKMHGGSFASGTALVEGGGSYYRYTFSGNGGYVKYDVNDQVVDSFGDLTSSADEAADALDWIEIRMEELDEQLAKLNAQLENAVGFVEQNNKIDQIITTNNDKYVNAGYGADFYEAYAKKYYNQIPAHLRDAADNGAINITDFYGETGEKAVEAIEKYRDYVQKAADLRQMQEELITENADLAKQKFDNVATQYENEIGLIQNVNDQIEAQISLQEDKGYVASAKYYESMITNTEKVQNQLKAQKDAMQSVLDAEVAAGRVEVGSDRWYEMVNALYEVDAQIVECTSSIEDFNNAINDIKWDNFENITNHIEYLSSQTQDLIDLMENSGDLFTKPEGTTYKDGTVKYWTADDVTWTEEGLASLGLYAQQMEMAEYEAQQYAKAIEELNKDFEAHKYSESEYLDKLDELTSAQYDAIDSYYEAQDAIVDLNSARIDHIKEGINKEVEALEELISKQKEQLNQEKD